MTMTKEQAKKKAVVAISKMLEAAKELTEAEYALGQQTPKRKHTRTSRETIEAISPPEVQT